MSTDTKSKKLTVREIAVFGLLGAIMFASKMLMEVFPNIHLLGALIVSMTVVFRAKALYPIYIYVFLDGLIHGFGIWWIPYLYVWTVLWGMTMLLPKNMPPKIAPIVYMTVSALHGFLFGVIYSPAQAILFKLSFKATLAWIAAGFPFDAIHGLSNFVCGLLIIPLIKVYKLSVQGTHHRQL